MTKRNDFDGEWIEQDCIYKVLETEDENVNKIIEKQKLNGKHWSKIVNNHCCREYTKLFAQPRLDSLSLTVTDHLSKIVKTLNEYTQEKWNRLWII